MKTAKRLLVAFNLIVACLAFAQTEAPPKPALFLIGDSTVRNGSGRGADGLWGWGSVLGEHFDAAKIRIENHAIGGRSSRTFFTEGRWNAVLQELKPGDFVMMQFGHNDGGGLTGNRGRGSLKGNGEETRTITNNAGNVETVHTYGWYLRRYIADAKTKGATPIVLSQIPRNIWKDGKVGRELNGYGKFAKEAAEQGGAVFIDLNDIVATRYEQEGEATVREKYFTATDHTHTTETGAKLNAGLVAGAVRKSGNVALGNALLPESAASLAGRAYLFSYFIGNGEDGLHFAWSRDGYMWQALNGGRSYLKPEVGESKLMRDPCLLRGPDGTFHLVWTTAWQGRTIGHASSKDLIKWSPQQSIPVMAHEPAALNCWAPEIVWDAKRGEFLIFWATTITNKFLETAGGGDEKYNHRMYATATKDFKFFTPAKLFYDPGFNVIDATILPANGRFYLIVKDETRRPPKKHLRIASSDNIAGPYENLDPPFTRDWVEGPSALQVGDEFLVYFDGYTAHRYEAMRSRDLRNWEDVSSRISFPKGTRHGTALAVETELVETLLRHDRERDGAPPK